MSLEGKKCPKFLGDTTGGISLSNKDFVGKNLIIFFYPKSISASYHNIFCHIDFLNSAIRIFRKFNHINSARRSSLDGWWGQKVG